jgi:hypothetical protein
MPELDAKMRTTASASKSTTNGISHHFFSRAQNRRNSRKTVHMDADMIMAGRDSVERQFKSANLRGASQFLAGWKPGCFQFNKSYQCAFKMPQTAPHPTPLPIGWGEGVRRTGEGYLCRIEGKSVSFQKPLLPPKGDKKRGRGENLCLSDLYVNYMRLPYGTCPRKYSCGNVMLFV